MDERVDIELKRICLEMELRYFNVTKFKCKEKISNR